MGDIIPFKRPEKRDNIKSRNRVVQDNLSPSSPEEKGFALRGYLERSYRFYIMRQGLPQDENISFQLTDRLKDALDMLAEKYGARALFDLTAVHVFFSRDNVRLDKDEEAVYSLSLSNDFKIEDVVSALEPVLKK